MFIKIKLILTKLFYTKQHGSARGYCALQIYKKPQGTSSPGEFPAVICVNTILNINVTMINLILHYTSIFKMQIIKFDTSSTSFSISPIWYFRRLLQLSIEMIRYSGNNHIFIINQIGTDHKAGLVMKYILPPVLRNELRN